ncbi:MAG TPA: DUF4388 domain-containing protein [Candidatus Limnocylindria bacterium]|nr:DUF4388 domain-containing protein [Candidatus Limnocylindria bacterium]
MTLRGSVASFPLETIVQLLAATAKTGQLEVRSSTETGTLGFAEGRLVSAVSGDDAGDAALGAVFTISDGDFEFVPWGEPPDANLAGDLNQLLDRAVVQRDKIVADREIISDDRVRFVLSDRAAAQGEVRLSAEQWRALLAVNGERDLPAIAEQLRLGRLATLAMLADLVRAGIVEVREAPPEPPSSGPGPGGGGGASETPAFTSAPPVREWDRPRSDAAAWPAPPEPVAEPPPVHAAEPEPAAPEPYAAAPEPYVPAPEPPPVVPETIAAVPERSAAPEPGPAPEPAPEIAAAWEAPPPIPPREVRTWDEPAARETPAWDRPATAEPEPELPSWDQPSPATELEQPGWDAALPEVRTWDTPAPAPAPPLSWEAPPEQTRSWQPPAAPAESERDWGLPAQDWEKASSSGPAWTAPEHTETARPDAALNDTFADRIASPEGQDTAPAAPPADTTIDERLSALSGLFGTPAAQPSAPAWPAEEPRATTFAPPPVAEPAPAPVEEPKKKGGLFSGLFKKEEPRAAAAAAPLTAHAQQTGSRAAKLAAFANALLDEFNNGQYGKGRVDDRIANLLMRVDEQADPIDRPLPIVDDRIDVATLERANMSESQVTPYLALLVSQIYQDAEHAFGKDKAKRGFKTVQAAVVGDAASLGTDLRLPRV